MYQIALLINLFFIAFLCIERYLHDYETHKSTWGDGLYETLKIIEIIQITVCYSPCPQEVVASHRLW